ncbi:MAG: helix-turn-helix transcriptional regulator [Cytophagaceae bacterium]|nr:helix-turn-helix transcriptional regulator [Cytophagaceae bacterium]
MEEYNKIIESINVRFLRSRATKVIQPLTVLNYYDVSNTLILLLKGEIYFGEDKTKLNEGDLLFVPGGKPTAICFGSKFSAQLSNEDLLTQRDKHLVSLKTLDKAMDGHETIFCYISFETKVFDSVNFFASLDIPCFAITDYPVLAGVVRETVDEDLSNNAGKNRVIGLNTDRSVIEIVRYILVKNLFVEKLATNSTYFKDPRLLDIFAYIKNHLGGDLSNKMLANVANVSEDYVGQYFKMLTGINPQDYIEYQRMEMAVDLLRTTKKSIREIGIDVGYKDTAYFCRRFKMMFGIPAGKMRRRESLMNV